ncbi:MAG: D-amino acid aminotransferase [Ruminococcaceae bacterium]|nr:D-amino acid aminotransferase [Oscillospiraceae bacterium]
MRNLGYYNGEIGLIEDMKVPMTDRGLYFGDGIYDAAYTRNHIIYALDEHIARFYTNLARLEIAEPMPAEELSALLRELVRRVDDGEQFVYWQATRGSALRDHSFPEGEQKSNLMIMLRHMPIKPVYTPIRLVSAEDRRYLYCNMKTLNLLPSVLTAEMAARAGVDETVMHRGDRVTECSHSNVSILKNGVFITPPADEYILPGVGRAHLIEASKTLGIPVEERIFTMRELRDADEIIVSSAGSLCLSARELDGESVGGKDPDTLRKLQDFVVADWLSKTEG